MTSQQILNLVQKEADIRFGQTIERLLSLLQNEHTHQCWKRECLCEYCQFINGKYVDNKLIFHRLKKHINYIDDYYGATWIDEDDLNKSLNRLFVQKAEQKWKIKLLKEHKKELRGNII
jgi:hypothetical protein